MKIELPKEKYDVNINDLRELIDFNLDDSYIDFIEKYGFGVIISDIEILNVMEPDKDFFKDNFEKYIDNWEWKDEKQKKLIKNSLLIAHTFDGQHIYMVDSNFIILPKFEEPIQFSNFIEIINFYIERYGLNKNIRFKIHKGIY